MDAGAFPQVFTQNVGFQCFVPSWFLWGQSVGARGKSSEEADILLELAYLVDQDWRDTWQRGHTAFRVGQHYRAVGDVRAAEQAFELALESLLISDAERAGAHASWSLQALGDLAREAEVYDLAITRYRESILQSPESAGGSFRGLASVWKARGYEVGYMLGQFEVLRERGDIEDPWLTQGAAQALFEIDAFDEAWMLIRGAPEAVQNTAPVLRIQGSLYERAGDLERAQQYYAEAIDLFLSMDPLQAAASAIDLGRVLAEDGNLKEALESYELAVELNPKAKWYWYRLGQLHLELEEMDKARYAFQQALELDPENEVFRMRLEEFSD